MNDTEHINPQTTGYFFQNEILFYDIVPYNCNISLWNWSNTMIIESTLWILMAWCFSTRASVAKLMSMHSFVSSYLWVDDLCLSSNLFQP